MRALTLALSLTACQPPEEAPPDLDALLRAYWATYADPTDDALATAIDDLFAITDLEALVTGPAQGSQSRLSAADQALVPLSAPPNDDGTWTLPDIALARPLYVVTRFPCAMDRLQAVLADPDQNAIYDAYDAYSRSFTSSVDDYLAGTTDAVTWEVTATASNIATGAYTELLLGGLRRVRRDDGDAVFARTHIPYPATTERENVSFVQDYQIEAYVSLDASDTEVLHVYGIWREMDLGSLGDMESNGVAQITLDNMASWDDKTAAACAN
jgi:hypothetical protein